MKISHNSDYYNLQIEDTVKCPKYNIDATITTIYTAEQLCKTDIQPTRTKKNYKCSLWGVKTTFPCIDCPVAPKDEVF